MEVQNITIDRAEAKRLYRAYKTHLHYSTPIDDEVRRTYQLIAQGRTIIKALESIKAAGVNAQGLPKLAIARADATGCKLTLDRDGSATMVTDGLQARTWSHPQTSRHISFPPDSFPRSRDWRRAVALVPGAPVHLRPRRGMQNYHILWEAEWTKIVPRDPLLLRRIGKGDLWLVLAAWDLTEVERAALAARL